MSTLFIDLDKFHQTNAAIRCLYNWARENTLHQINNWETYLKLQEELYFFLSCSIYFLVCIFITAQKMTFSINDLFSKCDQISSFLRIWSHLLKKSLMETSFYVQCSKPTFASRILTSFAVLPLLIETNITGKGSMATATMIQQLIFEYSKKRHLPYC